MTAPLDHRETSDRYHGEVFRRGGYRVIVCKDGIQWIAQGRRGDAWRAFGYFATRDALKRVWDAKTGALAPEIDALPERIKRRGAK